jgi:hypothetical protein
VRFLVVVPKHLAFFEKSGSKCDDCGGGFFRDGFEGCEYSLAGRARRQAGREVRLESRGLEDKRSAMWFAVEKDQMLLNCYESGCGKDA